MTRREVFMARTFDTSSDLLLFVSEEGISSTHREGYQWFWNKFMPALEKHVAETHLSKDVISDCCYIAGDVHDFNSAPKAAIREYKRTLEIDPTLGSAYREIAGMHYRMGEYDRAIDFSNTALKLWPDDESAVWDREELDKALAEETPVPWYEAGDPIWEADELLAQQKPDDALEKVAGRDDLEATLARLRCLGAKECVSEYLELWNDVAQKFDAIEFSYKDWFFMPEVIYDSPDIWRIFYECKAAFSGTFVGFDSLYDSADYRILPLSDKLKLATEFNFYSHSANLSGLRRLHQKYPEWKEVAEELESWPTT